MNEINRGLSQNPVDQFSSLGSQVLGGDFSGLGNAATGYGYSRASASLAECWGMSPMDLNTAFMGVSVLGNSVVGTRFVPGTEAKDLKDFPVSNGIGFRGILNRGPLGGAAGLPFDVIDIVLGYQGLPTASFRDYVNSGFYGLFLSLRMALQIWGITIGLKRL